MRRTIRAVVAMGVVTAAFLAALQTQAAPYNLGELISSGDSITFGDKVFDDFSLTGPDATTIAAGTTVTPSNIGNVYYLTFQGPFSSGLGFEKDFGLFYSVEATGGRLINAIDQAFNLTATGNGGTVEIGETVWQNGFFVPPFVAQSSVSFTLASPDMNDPPGELFQGDDLLIDPGLTKVYVTKDILLTPSDAGSKVSATIISQSFHQNAVPDGGSTLLLLGSALTSLGFITRRFRK